MRRNLELNALKETPPWEWPDDAGKTLLAILRDDQADESDRVLAAELAGDSTVINDELADLLMSIVRSGDEPAALRASSAIALGPVLDLSDTDGFDDPEDTPITEDTFLKIQESFRELYADASIPKEVRRRILEASVRAPQDWHADAIRAAYANKDEGWKLTAVFAMGYVPGFGDQILEALESSNPEIHLEAVGAAGNRELKAAWPHLAALLTSEDTDKPLLLAAIEAVTYIRPDEAGELLADLAISDDEEIADAAQEAMSMAEALSGDGEDSIIG